MAAAMIMTATEVEPVVTLAPGTLIVRRVNLALQMGMALRGGRQVWCKFADTTDPLPVSITEPPHDDDLIRRNLRSFFDNGERTRVVYKVDNPSTYNITIELGTDRAGNTIRNTTRPMHVYLWFHLAKAEARVADGRRLSWQLRNTEMVRQKQHMSVGTPIVRKVNNNAKLQMGVFLQHGPAWCEFTDTPDLIHLKRNIRSLLYDKMTNREQPQIYHVLNLMEADAGTVTDITIQLDNEEFVTNSLHVHWWIQLVGQLVNALGGQFMQTAEVSLEEQGQLPVGTRIVREVNEQLQMGVAFPHGGLAWCTFTDTGDPLPAPTMPQHEFDALLDKNLESFMQDGITDPVQAKVYKVLNQGFNHPGDITIQLDDKEFVPRPMHAYLWIQLADAKKHASGGRMHGRQFNLDIMYGWYPKRPRYYAYERPLCRVCKSKRPVIVCKKCPGKWCSNHCRLRDVLCTHRNHWDHHAFTKCPPWGYNQLQPQLRWTG